MKIIRSARKTICIRVLPGGEVIVRAPIGLTDIDINRFLEKKKAWIDKSVDLMKSRKVESFSNDQIQKMRQEAKEIIPERVKNWSVVMGLKPSQVKITSAKKRFGSCSSKNSLCFSLYLMRFSLFEIDYVIVHELAHIKYHNHSKKFYKLIETYLPDYRDRERSLRNTFE